MLELRFHVDGEEQRLRPSETQIRFGRSAENDVVLPDYSVSRRHATLKREETDWVLSDLGSTNGVQVDGRAVDRVVLRPGMAVKIGVFDLYVHEVPADEAPAAPPADLWASRPSPSSSSTAPEPPTGPAVAPSPPGLFASARTQAPGPEQPAFGGTPTASGTEAAISNATIVRSLRDFSAEYGLDEELGSGSPIAGDPLGRDSSAIRRSKREALDEAYASHVFGFLTRLARLLITTESDDAILRHVMNIAFEVFPVDRGFILLRDEETGELECELVRVNERVELRPESEVPISKTMLEAVMRERVALLTYDALSDQRLAGTESVRIHQIRAAMCTPLWSGEKIIGVMQLDTPHHTGTFTEPDVDLLATLANYCAVAIERNRNARDAEFQREVRNRLQRYHSPSVIEEVLQEETAPDGTMRKLKEAEVTVLFADIVGFTAYSEHAAPEEVAELMEGYFTHAVEAIFEHGGTLDKFIGDCVMAFFGAPMAQPDHAYRAVAAACRIRDALAQWNDEREAEGLARIRARVALNSGPVVVGDIGSNRRVDYTVLGNTVNVAARLEESVAAPGDVVLGATTHRLLGGRIPTESLGEFQLKGLQQKIVAYRVPSPR
ncbi:MAG: adenylate/guanylate cyclase domain-containing protein [Acidobacteriota bacterium]